MATAKVYPVSKAKNISRRNVLAAGGNTAIMAMVSAAFELGSVGSDQIIAGYEDDLGTGANAR